MICCIECCVKHMLFQNVGKCRGRLFYCHPEHDKCRGVYRRVQAFYAVKLPWLVTNRRQRPYKACSIIWWTESFALDGLGKNWSVCNCRACYQSWHFLALWCHACAQQYLINTTSSGTGQEGFKYSSTVYVKTWWNEWLGGGGWGGKFLGYRKLTEDERVTELRGNKEGKLKERSGLFWPNTTWIILYSFYSKCKISKVLFLTFQNAALAVLDTTSCNKEPHFTVTAEVSRLYNSESKQRVVLLEVSQASLVGVMTRPWAVR